MKCPSTQIYKGDEDTCVSCSNEFTELSHDCDYAGPTSCKDPFLYVSDAVFPDDDTSKSPTKHRECLRCSQSLSACHTCTGPDRCTSCSDFYYPRHDTGKCARCPFNCLKCSSGSKCTQCDVEYYLNSEGTCLRDYYSDNNEYRLAASETVQTGHMPW